MTIVGWLLIIISLTGEAYVAGRYDARQSCERASAHGFCAPAVEVK